MTDRELWLKTCKTVGAMTGGTLVLLGSMTLFLMLVVGRPASSSSEALDGPATAPGEIGNAGNGAGMGNVGGAGKVDTVATPPTPRMPRRHGAKPEGRPGESI